MMARRAYAGSYSHKTRDGLEWKRGELAEAAAREAGLEFKIAGSTGNQISFHDMPEFYKSVDAVLVSSLTEGAGLPAREPAAAGRLVISTPVGDFPLLASQGIGIIAPIEAHKYKNFVAATLKHYKESPAEFLQTCRKAQDAAREVDWQYMIGHWIELIETAKAHGIADSIGTSESGLTHLARPAMSQTSGIEEKAIEDGTDRDLIRLAEKYRVDKWGEHWYIPHYHRHFKSLRHQKINVLEIGVGGYEHPSQGGQSLRMWEEYFSNAIVYGIDIHDKKIHERNRVRIRQGSQDDERFLRSVVEETNGFDIIIDDGSHHCRPVKQAVSAHKGMILRAILAN